VAQSADKLPLLPCVDRNAAAPAVLSDDRPFAYEGRPFTAPEFAAYISTYDIGTIPPDYVVIHNTAIPDATWARYRTDGSTWWDRDEAGLSENAIKHKRNKQLDSIKSYYKALGWTAGPHLFIDERWIWLFTPLRQVGIHAAEGNSYTVGGKLHYSVGVEMIGYFGRLTYHPQQSALLRSALTAIRNRWKTFDFVYTAAPLHRPDLHRGGISLHRDYNKPACPAAAITPEYVISVLNATPAAPVSPLLRYRLKAPAAIFETPTPRGPIALGGGAKIEEGAIVVIDDLRADGWAHIGAASPQFANVGFLPVGVLELV
jgi:hypothetical protein